MDCEVTNVSYGGLEQDGVFYVTDIIIEYECSGSGTNDGDPDPGLDNGGGEFPLNEGPQGGGGGGNGEQIPTVIINETPPPSCKSFKFSQDSGGLTQTAAVVNVSFRVRYIDPNTGDFKTSDVVFLQPIYFTVPRFHSQFGNLTTGAGANRAAKALLSAHTRATAYFLATDATESQVRTKLWEYIKDEMQNGSHMTGGSASFNPPLGGFSGTPNQYETTLFIMDDCN